MYLKIYTPVFFLPRLSKKAKERLTLTELHLGVMGNAYAGVGGVSLVLILELLLLL